MTSATELPFVLPTDATPMLEAAEMYVAAGLPPIPLYGVRPGGECMCGKTDCEPRARGKHPIGGQWQKRASLDLDDVRDRFRGHMGNVGIYLALGRLVLIDADGELGLATAKTWELPETLTAQSGSGVGAHFIYRFADNQNPLEVTDRSKFAPGLDVKARGQFAAAPSRHFSGGQYRWTLVRPPAELPTWLFDRIKKQPVASAMPEPPSGTHAVTGDVSTLEKRARSYMATVPAAISGAGGHNQCFAAARSLAAFVVKGLPEPVALGLLAEYNATCQPPWSERELAHKWADAMKSPARIEDRPPPRLRLVGRPPSAAAPADEGPPLFDDDAPGPPDGPAPPAPPGDGGGRSAPDWRALLRWKVSARGNETLISAPDNVAKILRYDPRWADKIQFDAFRHRIAIATDLPWEDYARPTTQLGYWTDEDATRMAGWMARDWHGRNFEPSINDCEKAVAMVARTRDFNPVKDYLDSVAWDGTPRLGTWLATHLGAEQNEYARCVGAWWLISAVARIFVPGEKVDTVPILEGPQGLKKSTALKVLAGPEFFNDTPIDIGTKDAYTAIQGCWFVELAELESLMRSTPTKSKAFFSSSKDRFRRAYARHEKDELRQCIFVGTVNLSQYLSDPTGSRRFWPIKCTRIDIDALTRDRDQLWAEAVHEYQAGRPWYPDAEADHVLVQEPQETRTMVDTWEEKIARWLATSGLREVSTTDILQTGLNIEAKDWTIPTQTRVGVVMMSRLKWTKRRVSRPEGRIWVYERPEPENAERLDRQQS